MVPGRMDVNMHLRDVRFANIEDIDPTSLRLHSNIVLHCDRNTSRCGMLSGVDYLVRTSCFPCLLEHRQRYKVSLMYLDMSLI